MQYCAKYRNLISRIVIMAFLIITAFSCFSIKADAKYVEFYPGRDYSDGKFSAVSATDNNVVSMKKGDSLAFDVDFETEPTSFTIELSTNADAAGYLEVRLDQQDGELLAKIESERTSTWTRRSYTEKIEKEIVGKHKIWFCFKEGTHSFHSLSFWVPGYNGGRYPQFEIVDKYSDIANSKYREEINLLYGLKILNGEENTKFSPDLPATRGEFALALSNCFGVQLSQKNNEIFKDVKTDNRYFDAVSTLAALNVIKTDEELFRPTDYITYDEASQMMIRALGINFTNITQREINRVIRDKKLFNNIDDISGYVGRDEMACLIYNTILASNIEVSAFEPGEKYSYADGDGILATRNIYHSAGIVDANNYYSLNSNSENLNDGVVTINGEKFNVGKTTAANYVGFDVVYFYEKANDGTKTLLGVLLNDSVEYMDLYSNEVEFVQTDERLISYYEDDSDKLKKIELPTSAVIMYNDKLIDGDLAQLLSEDGGRNFDGHILLIDNDGDKVYDTVKIYHAVSIIFGGFADNTIYDKLRSKSYQVNNIDNILFYEDDSLIDINSLKVGSVIELYMSKNSDGLAIQRAIVCNDEIEASISQITVDNKLVFDNGIEYTIYDYCNDNYTAGQDVLAKLNSYGKIVYIETMDFFETALLKKTAISTENPFEYSVKIQIFSLDCNDVELELAGNVTADGVRCKTAQQVYDGYEEFVGIKNIAENEVIRYRLNKEGKVNAIDTPQDGKGGPYDVLKSLTNGKGSYIPRPGMLMGGTNNGVCPIMSDAKVFDIYLYNGIEKINVRSGLPTGNDSFNINAYTTAKDGKVSDIAIRYFDNKINTEYPNAIVVDEVTTKIENEEEVICVSGYTGVGNVSLTVDMKTYYDSADFRKRVDSIKKGDFIIPYTFNKTNLVGMEYLYMGDGNAVNSAGVESVLNDTDFDTRTAASKNGVTSPLQRTLAGITFHGTVIDRDGNYIKLRLGTDISSPTEWVNCASAGVIVCEGTPSHYTVTNKQGIHYLGVGEHVFVTFAPYNYLTQTVVVYR